MLVWTVKQNIQHSSNNVSMAFLQAGQYFESDCMGNNLIIKIMHKLKTMHAMLQAHFSGEEPGYNARKQSVVRLGLTHVVMVHVHTKSTTSKGYHDIPTVTTPWSWYMYTPNPQPPKGTMTSQLSLHRGHGTCTHQIHNLQRVP